MTGKLRNGYARGAAALLAAALVAGAAVPAALAETVSTGQGVSAAVQASVEQDGVTHIVAIGDSLTAGYEFGMEHQASPVPYGYVDRLYEQGLWHGRTEMSNYGIIGLKVGDLRKLVGAVETETPITAPELPSSLIDPRAAAIVAASARIRSDLTQADLVAVTIGANDFSALVKTAIADRESWLAETLAMYDTELDALLRSIYRLQPGAEIVIADQYSPVPNLPVLGIQESDYLYYWETAGKFRTKLEEIAARFAQEGFKLKIAYAAEGFKGKESALTTIIAGKGDFHPNQKGYAVMGEAFAKAVWGEYRTAAARTADVPISVVVNGKEVVSPFKPVSKAGRTYLVLADIAKAMGAQLMWDNKAKTATLKLNGHTVALTVGATTMTVDGVKTAIETPAFLLQAGKEQKTYVPLSAIATGLGLQVVYRAPLKTAFINK